MATFTVVCIDRLLASSCHNLHRIALCFLFAPRRTTLAYVREFVRDRNHIANLAGPQHVGTRWRTLYLPNWQSEWVLRRPVPLFLATGNSLALRESLFL